MMLKVGEKILSTWIDLGEVSVKSFMHGCPPKLKKFGHAKISFIVDYSHGCYFNQ